MWNLNEKVEQKMREQIHGGDIYRNRDVIDFSVNSNPLGPPKSVLETIREQAGKIVHYPDILCSELRDAIGWFEGVDSEQILCGNGAAELFFSAVLAVKPEHALLIAPTFAEYEKALNVVDAQIDYYELKEEQQFQVQKDILEQITSDVDIMFLCNPNNPTGQLMSKEMIRDILMKCRECDTWLVLDECFIDFLDCPEMYEVKELICEYENLLIVKAFTKVFCMPGLRLGYAMSGNRKLLRKMALVLQPWNVSILAQAGGIAALSGCEEYISKTRQFIKDERLIMIQALEDLGYCVYGSKANYVFFQGKSGLYEQALAAGFLIRDCQNYRGLSEGYYRIAVRTKSENERLIAWLRQL